MHFRVLHSFCIIVITPLGRLSPVHTHRRGGKGLEPFPACIGTRGGKLKRAASALHGEREWTNSCAQGTFNLSDPTYLCMFGLWEKNPCKHERDHANATVKLAK